MDLREHVTVPVEIEQKDVDKAQCGFALVLFAKLNGLSVSIDETCYACGSRFARNSDGHIEFSGQCIGTPSV